MTEFMNRGDVAAARREQSRKQQALEQKARQLDDVVYELRNHTTMCPPECTPAKHIAAVYADGEECTNLMREYLYKLRRVKEALAKRRTPKDTVKALRKMLEDFR